MNRRQLEIEIIRCAERWPDRVGLYQTMHNRDCSDHCIAGQIGHNLGGCSGGMVNDPLNPMYGGWMLMPLDAIELGRDMVRLNNAGVRWGEFPRLLGLVQGEEPADAPNSPVAQGARALEPAAHSDWSQPIPEEVTA